MLKCLSVDDEEIEMRDLEDEDEFNQADALNLDQQLKKCYE